MAEILQEKWMKGVAVTTTVLAVMTAIAASRGAAVGAKIQLLTAVEGSKWGYYQAKSIKQHLMESQKDNFKGAALGATLPEQKSFYESKLSGLEEEIARYDKEKAQIKQEAEETGKEDAVFGRRANQFSLSVVFFQVAIMLSSVSALLKRKEMWIVGILLGVVAATFLANGLVLFF